MNRILTFGQFMSITGVLLIVGGTVFLLFPTWLWYLLGIHSISRDFLFLTRAQVPWALSMGVLALLLREEDASEAHSRAYLWALMTGCVVAFLLAAYGSVVGILSGFGWFLVVIFLSIGLLGGYFLTPGSL